MSNNKISVIIPTRNEANKIGQCLTAVFNQTCPPYEVIVVDGHSTDNTSEVAKTYPVTVLTENFGSRAGACQVGIENAKGDYVAFTDADCIPANDWLEKLINSFMPDIAGVGGTLKSVGDTLWEKSINLAFGSFLGSANSLQGRTFKENRFVSSISGANSMYRKQDLQKVNGFTTNLKGAEDLELNSRMRQLGKLLYVPKALVIHSHSWTLKEFAKKMYRYGKERGQVRKWNLQVAPALVLPFILLSVFVSPWILVGLLCIYLLLILGYGLKCGISEKTGAFVLSVPTIYVIEHGLYSLGLWVGWL